MSAEKFCPSCHYKNKPDAQVCVHCGRSLENLPKTISTSRLGIEKIDKVVDISSKSSNEINKTPPSEGIAIYTPNQNQPLEVRLEEEFIIGRKTEEIEIEPLVDLTPLEGFDLGVSRHHVKVRRAQQGYELIDLESMNGTWVNEQRIPSNQAYPLENGSALRLGKLKLVVIFND